MDPQGPPQPSLNTAYTQPNNPISQSSHEQSQAQSTDNAPTQATRAEPDTKTAGAQPTSLAYGVRDASQDAGESIGAPASDLEGEQLRATGEGAIASAQHTKHGFGEQPSLTAGLDRKREEHDSALHQSTSSAGDGESGKVDVGKVLGGTGFVAAGAGEAGTGTGSGQMGGVQSDHSHV